MWFEVLPVPPTELDEVILVDEYLFNELPDIPVEEPIEYPSVVEFVQGDGEQIVHAPLEE